MTDSNTNNSDFHWPTLVQLIFSGLAVLISWGLSLLLVIGAVNEFLDPSYDVYQLSSLVSLVLASLLIGGLFCCALFYSFMRLIGRPVILGAWWQKLRKIFHPKHFLISYPVILLLGYYANQADLPRNLVLPLLNILAMVVPVMGLVWLALRGLPKGSPQLGWGALSLGLTIGPTVVLFLEVLVLILMVVVLAISAGSNPELMEIISNFSLLTFEADNPYALDQALGDLFNNSQFLIAVLVVLAGFVPLIEELFKPISVWVLAGRKLRPVDGWVIGALSGAGFALFESLGQATVSEDWLIGVIGRLGASIPHVFTTALMGYTFTLARSQKKYGSVLAVFVGVVAIHGAWNASSVLMAAASYAPEDAWLQPWWANVFLVVICAMGVGMVAALIALNRKLHRENYPAVPDLGLPAAPLSQDLERDAKETKLDGNSNDDN